jgi:hypothetical protein
MRPQTQAIKKQLEHIITNAQTKEHEPLDAHCTKSGCSCAHDYCYRGWIDTPDSTYPCPYCRASLNERQHNVSQAAAKGYPQAALYRIGQKPTQQEQEDHPEWYSNWKRNR